MNLKDYAHLFTEKPCSDAIEWLKTQESPSAAWENCHRGDWLWWALRNGEDTLPAKEVSVAFADWCAKHVAYAAYVADVAYAAYVAYAADAAYAAAYVAYAADAYVAYVADAAYAAAYAATDATDAADAAYAAAYAATDAADAAYAYAAAYAAYVAYAAERLAQADWIRANVKMPESWR